MEVWTYEKCRCGHPSCSQFTISNQGSVGFCEDDARLICAAKDLLASLDPETLEAIADEIECFEHSARSRGLRGIAKRQRAAIEKAEGVK